MFLLIVQAPDKRIKITHRFIPPLRFRAKGRNRRLASFYFYLKSNFEKSRISQAKYRETAKNEENPRKSRVFRLVSIKTGTLGMCDKKDATQFYPLALKISKFSQKNESFPSS